MLTFLPSILIDTDVVVAHKRAEFSMLQHLQKFTFL